MSGVRHHVLPQFLLAGFANRVVGSESYAWLYRRNCEPVETNIKNIYVERDFYGPKGSAGADAAMTALESQYALLIAGLRKQPNGYEVADPLFPEFVAHLAVRSRHMRLFVLNSTEFMVHRLKEHFASARNVVRFIKRRPDMIAEKTEKMLIEHGLGRRNLERARTRLPALTEVALRNNAGLLQLIGRSLVSRIEQFAPQLVANAHNESLAREPMPESRAETYRALRWRVDVLRSGVILGDSGCLFESRVGKPVPLDDRESSISRAFVPVSSQRVVVGSLTLAPQTDSELLRKMTARCASNSFVAAQDSSDLRSLQGQIGRDAQLIGPDEMERMLLDVLEDTS